MAIVLYWELIHPTRKEDWFYLLEFVILKFTTMFTLIALLLFILCGQLLIVYHRKIAEELTQLISKEINQNSEDYYFDDELWSILSHFQILCEAKKQLFRNFRSMLMMNCCLSVVNVVTCSYFAINHIFISLFWIVVMWDISDIVEFTFRLWLVGHITDQIRSSVSHLKLK